MKNTDKTQIFRIRFDVKSFLIAIFIFLIEVLIALYVDDKFIRPYLGDVLVVILIYYFVKAFIETKKAYLLLGVLLFAYAVEVAQYFNAVELLGLQDYKVARIVIGSVFSWWDMLCYTIGILICYLLELSNIFGYKSAVTKEKA